MLYYISKNFFHKVLDSVHMWSIVKLIWECCQEILLITSIKKNAFPLKFCGNQQVVTVIF